MTGAITNEKSRVMFKLALYQVIKENMTKWWRHKIIFSYHTKAYADKVSLKLNDQVKSYPCPNFNTKTVPNNDAISGKG